MTEGALPASLYSNKLNVLGIEVVVHVLDNGQRVIEGDGMARLVEALFNGEPMTGNQARDLALALAGRTASVDRNPEGEKPQALSAEHESAAPEADAQIPNDYNAQSPLPAPPDNQ